MSKVESVAVVGYGYWGQKLAAKFNSLKVLERIADQGAQRLSEAGEKYPHIYIGSVADVMQDLCIKAVVIATPPETHYELVKQALEANKHVFCEKPLATGDPDNPEIGCYEQARELEDLAIAKNLRLQVGHIYLWNTGLTAIPKPYGAAELHVRLLNVGGAPSDSTRDLLWAGLPHTLSVCAHFLGENPDAMMVNRRENTIEVVIHYHTRNSTCFMEVSDFTGTRQRSVHLSCDDRSYVFHADDPNHFSIFPPNSANAVAKLAEAGEPLMMEVNDFLTGEVITDRMGSKVAKLTDQVLHCIDKGEVVEKLF